MSAFGRVIANRKFQRIVLWLFALCVLAAAALVLSLQFWILPNLDRWREPIAESISNSAGQPVQLGRIDAGWKNLHPTLRIQSIQVFSPKGQPLLYLNDVSAEISWTSLVLQELRLARLTLNNQVFALHRTVDGTLWLAGIPLNRNTHKNGFADWLLKQRRIELNHATVSWQDDMRQSPILTLTEVNFDLSNRRGQHQFHLSATPPELVAHPVSIDGNVQGRNTSMLAEWSGQVDVRVTGTDLAQWQPWITLPMGINRGYGDLGVQFQFAKTQLIQLTARILLHQLSLQISPDLPRLELIDLSGLAQWKRLGAAQSFELKQVSLRSSNLTYMAPLDFYLRLTQPGNRINAGGELRANNLPLESIARLSAYLPLTVAQRQWLDQHHPAGLLQQMNARWQGDAMHPNDFKLSGQFSGLKISAVDKQPGFSGLSGQIDGDSKSGSLALSSQKTGIDLPALLFEPHIALDSLAAQLRWQKEGSGYRLKLSQANLANSDFTANLFGDYLWQPGTPGTLNLSGGLIHGRGSAVCHYLPLAIKQPAHDWICSNLLDGTAEQTRFHIQGDLAHYPFHNDRNGLLDVSVQVKDGVMRPAPDFPAIDHVNGLLQFAGTRMSFHGNSARLYDTQLRNISAEIPDLFGADRESLLVYGEAQGNLSDFIRFTNNSPVGKALDNIALGATSRGTAKLALHLQLPFHDIMHPIVSGLLTFNNDHITPGNELPPMDAISGKLAFSQSGISAKKISLMLFDHPAAFSSEPQANGATLIKLHGQIAAPDLAQWLGKDLTAKLSGQTNWQGQFMLQHGQMADMLFDSNLDGLAIDLPAPLGKSADSRTPFHLVTHTPKPGQTRIKAQFNQTTSVQLLTLQSTPGINTIERGNINFGGSAALPDSSGIWITGKLDDSHLENWLGAIPEGQSDSPIRDINLTIAHFHLFDRNFANISLHAHDTNGRWLATVQGTTMQGELNWIPPETTTPRGLLSAHFKTLAIPASDGTSTGSGKSDSNHWPALAINVDALQLGERHLGHLEAHALPIPNGLNFDHIAVTHSDSALNLSAIWHPQAQPQTDAKIHLAISNLGQFFSRFGEADTIRRGRATLDGEASWDGAPIDIPIASLNGNFTLKAENGQFLKIEPGAAKLLGVLSLQDLPRHIGLDFHDVFSDGFAFDDISATIQLNRGIIYSKDFVMQGSAATVQIQGSADMNAQTQNLRASVSPKLSESVALASSLVGGPVVGLGVLAVQKLLENPFGHAVRFDYAITGSWTNPVVNKSGRNDEN